MKQVGANPFRSISEGLAFTASMGTLTLILLREAYHRQDATLFIDAAIGLVGTGVLTYNTMVLSLYGDQDQTHDIC